MRETQILRGLGKAREAVRSHGAPMAPSPLHSLRRGAASLQGPGTATSDSIPAHLSKGEAVLPAKTVAALGPQNISNMIQQTTGKAPAPGGLRSGGHYSGGNNGGIPANSVAWEDPNFTPGKPTSVGPTEPTLSSGADGSGGSATRQPRPNSFGDAAAASADPQTKIPDINQNYKAASDARMGMPQQPQAQPTPQPTPTPEVPPTPEAPPRPGTWTGRAQQTMRNAWNKVNTAGIGEAAPVAAEATTPLTRMQSLRQAVGGVSGYGIKGRGGFLGAAGRLAGAPLAVAMGAYQAANDSDENVKKLAGSVNLDYNSDGDRIAANTINFLQKTGNAATFGLAGAIGRKFGGGSLFEKQAPVQPDQQGTATAAPEPYKLSTAAQGGRGFVNPALVNGATDAQYPGSVPGRASILKTVDSNGKVSYSGTGDGTGVGGNAVIAGPDGRATGMRGTLTMLPKGVTPALGGGGYAFSSDGQGSQNSGGPDVGAALQAAAKRGDWSAVKNYYNSTGQTFDDGGLAGGPGAGGGFNGAGGTGGLAKQLLAQRAQNNMSKFGSAGLGTLREMAGLESNELTNQTARRGQNMTYDTAMDEHSVQRDHYKRQLAFDQSKLGMERMDKGGDMFDKLVDSSPYAHAMTPDGNKADEAESKRYTQFMNGSNITVGGMPIQQALASGNPELVSQARQATSRMSGMYGLAKKVRDSGGNTFYTNVPKANALKLSKEGIAPTAWSDYLSGQTATNILRDELLNNDQIHFEGLGGRGAVISSRDLRNDPEMMAALDAMIEDQRAREQASRKR